MAILKIITVYQPWASLIAIGAKPYEFRGWVPPASIIGQRIGIHASARPIKRQEINQLLMQLDNPERYGVPCLHPGLAKPVLTNLLNDPDCLPRSHILCTAILGTPKRGDLCAEEFGADAGNDSDRDEHFNWGWPLLDIEELSPPVPARGAQGFWNWNDGEGV